MLGTFLLLCSEASKLLLLIELRQPGHLLHAYFCDSSLCFFNIYIELFYSLCVEMETSEVHSHLNLLFISSDSHLWCCFIAVCI